MSPFDGDLPVTGKTVTIVCPYYAPDMVGGAEYTIKMLAESLAQRGHLVHVVCFSESTVGDAFLEGVVVHRLRIRRQHHPASPKQQKSLGDILAIATELAAINMDVVNAVLATAADSVIIHNRALIGLSTIAALARSHPNVFIFLHDLGYGCARATMRRRGSSCQGACLECSPVRHATRSAAPDLKGVIYNSNFLRERYESLGIFHKLPSVVAHTAIDSPRLGAVARDFRGVRTVGYLGRLAPEKGVEVAIRALARTPDLKLLIAGSGTPAYVESLQRLADDLAPDRITFLGNQPVDVFLAQVDALIVPSLWEEPLGRVLLEGYATGIPVIASETGGLGELMKGNQAAIPVPPGDEDALAEALRLLVDTPPDAKALAEARAFALGFDERRFTDTIVGFVEMARERTLEEIGALS